jgi:hypothetical protein
MEKGRRRILLIGLIPRLVGKSCDRISLFQFLNTSNQQTTLIEHFGRAELSVRRRYSDFVWLNGQLQEEFPACIVPPLPAKQRMGW